MLQTINNNKLIYGVIPAVIIFLLWGIVASIGFFPEPIGSRAAMFVTGIKLTIYLSVLSGAIGIIIGIITGIARLSSNKFIYSIATFYVWLFTGTPLLTQILFMYYILPACIPSLKFDEFSSALVALALNVGSYNADVVRSGIIAVPKQQTESGLSLGLTKFQVMRFVVFPQAIRICILPLANNFIVLLKDSSLASAIGLLDLSLVGTRVISETFEPIPVLLTVSCIYLLLTTICKIAIYVVSSRSTIVAGY